MALVKYREPNQVKWVGVRPAHDGEQVLAHTNADNADVSIYTVPAGKVFHLCNIALGYLGIAAGRTAIYIQDPVPLAVTFLIQETILAGSEGKAILESFWPPIELSAGYSLVVGSNAAGLWVRGSCYGWVE